MTTEKTETALVSLEGTPLATLANAPTAFGVEYKKQIERVLKNLPSDRSLNETLDNLPDETADKLSALLNKLNPEKQGIYTSDDKPMFPDLKIHHGVGKDPNRPEKMYPGQLYLTSQEVVGETFIGSVLFIYEGRTMWEKGTDAPVCQSMDRKIGSTYGNCVTCPNRPWAAGQKTDCSDDVTAYVLRDNLDDIVVIRFSKTSGPAGTRLIKALRRAQNIWDPKIKFAVETATNENNTWYKLTAAKVTEGERYTPEALSDFCKQMSVSIEATFILPTLGMIYSKAAEGIVEDAEETTPLTDSSCETTEEVDYDSF
jgi:hypothetical protein